MPVNIQVAPGATAPIYQQITDQVRRAVARSELAMGEQLPSVRQLAELLTVNPNTVARAYNELVKEGVLECRTGVGAFVGRKRKVFTRQERLRRLRPKIDDLIQSALALDFTASELKELLTAELTALPNTKPS